MLNWLAKILLIATSLSPVLGAVAISQIAKGQPLLKWLPWVLVGLLLVLLCWLLLLLVSKTAQKNTISIQHVEGNDKDVLAFLLAYLLPFISSENMAFGDQWITGAYILLIIFIVIAHAEAFHFNPVMGFLGYHFYSIRTFDNVSQLLISKSELCKVGEEVETVKLTTNIYLQVGGSNA